MAAVKAADATAKRTATRCVESAHSPRATNPLPILKRVRSAHPRLRVCNDKGVAGGGGDKGQGSSRRAESRGDAKRAAQDPL